MQAIRPLSREDIEHVLRATSTLWSDLDGARLLITGGTGFTGLWLLETYLAARARFKLKTTALVLTRDAARFTSTAPHVAGHEAITLLEGDVRSFTAPAGECPFVIHGATSASAKLNEDDPLEMFETIVDGTRHVLDLAGRAQSRRLLLLSSGAVYGPQPSDLERVSEGWAGGPVPTASSSAYAEGKRVAELLCAMESRRQPSLQPVIARGFAFVGPHLPLERHFAIGNFIGDVLAGRPIRIAGDGTPLRSYLYAADLAIWLWTILFRGTPLRPYNVGSENALSIRETAELVADATRPQSEVVVAGTADPGSPPARYVPSTERARTELGLSQSIDLQEAVRRTIEWHRPPSGRS